MEGSSARDLNRGILSALRKVERRTRLRAEWTDEDGQVYRFFDYVLKSTGRKSAALERPSGPTETVER